jgi:hypothetical protein
MGIWPKYHGHYTIKQGDNIVTEKVDNNSNTQQKRKGNMCRSNIFINKHQWNTRTKPTINNQPA